MTREAEISKLFYDLRREQNFADEAKCYAKAKKLFKNKPFYRLEKDGLGPWYSFRTNSEEGEHWIDSSHRRGLERDSSYVNDVWKFTKHNSLSACYSLENLKNWFSATEWKRLISEGYEVKEHYLDKDFCDLFFADNQVILLRDPEQREKVLKEVAVYHKKLAVSYDRLLELTFSDS